jgi:hypothetical protein
MIGMPKYKKRTAILYRYEASFIKMRSSKQKYILSVGKLFIAFGTFDLAFPFVFPIMVAICPQVYSRGDISDQQDNRYNS